MEYAQRNHAEAVLHDDHSGARLMAPAATRNAPAITEALMHHIRLRENHPITMLELGSGTGQHAAHLVTELTTLHVQPTDYDASARSSCDAYRDALPPQAMARLAKAVALDLCAADATTPPCPFERGPTYDLVLCVNVLHISPKAAMAGAVRHATAALHRGGLLAIYGPFLVDGRPTTDSNAAFDAKLKAMDVEFGLRDVADVTAVLSAHGAFRHVETLPMPSNNFFLFYERC